MGRPGWPLTVLLALLGSYLAVAVAIAVWPRGENVHGSGPKLHPPTSTEERAAAGAGLAYLRALQRGDALAACRHADGGAARLLRCGRSMPRVPRELRPGGSLKAVDADVDGATAGLGISSAGCVNFLSLRRSAGAWLVTGHHCGGYA
jgi:hypothetical protein